jgi:hypothetical protein
MRRFRLGFIALTIAMVVAMTFWTGGAGRPAAAASTPIGASLYGPFDAGITPGGFVPTIRRTPTSGLQVHADIPDLRVLNFNDKALALTVSVPTAVAAYSDINYSGTCETFFGTRLYDLADTMLGPRSISSIRLNYTCLGPTTEKPVVTDISFAPSDTRASNRSPGCPNTYTRIKQDLHESLSGAHIAGVAHGNWLYMCVQYGPPNNTTVLRDATVVMCEGPTSICGPDSSLVKSSCPSPSKAAMNADLNQTIAGFPAVYLCITPFTPGVVRFSNPTPLRDVTAFGIPFADIGNASDAMCAGYLSVPNSSAHLDLTPLNAHADNLFVEGLHHVYLCTSTYSGPDAAKPLGDATPPTISGAAMLWPSNCAIFCRSGGVPSGSTVTIPGTVSVRWVCSDDSGSATPSPPEDISRNGVWILTGTCTDAWGNQSTATFHFVRDVP